MIDADGRGEMAPEVALGYTTLDHADQLSHLLDLRPGDRLLELGSGGG